MTDGLLLCDDLIFASKVTATATAHGLTVKVCKTPATLRAEAGSPRGVIIDLNTSGLDIPGTVAAWKALSPPPRVIGFGSHVDTATLNAAREAGCDEVMPRSKFVKELEEKLAGWLE